jgi:hypothetical protein
MFRPDYFSFSWTADQISLKNMDAGGALDRLLSPSNFAAYTVYLDGQGSHVAAGYQRCVPGPGQVALYLGSGFREGCLVLPVGNYLSSAAIGIPEDSISSIMVASDVRAYLCTEGRLRGRCALWVGDAGDLSRSNVGDNQVSSLRVEPIDDCAPGPDEVALFMNPKFDPPCERRSFGRYDSPKEIGLPDDSISSVRVGKNVRLTLCRGRIWPAPVRVSWPMTLLSRTMRSATTRRHRSR